MSLRRSPIRRFSRRVRIRIILEEQLTVVWPDKKQLKVVFTTNRNIDSADGFEDIFYELTRDYLSSDYEVLGLTEEQVHKADVRGVIAQLDEAVRNNQNCFYMTVYY